MLGSGAEGKAIDYAFWKFAACWSAIISSLSILLAFLILQNNVVLLMVYLVFTSVLAVIMFKLKIRTLSGGGRSDGNFWVKLGDDNKKLVVLFVFFVIVV